MSARVAQASRLLVGQIAVVLMGFAALYPSYGARRRARRPHGAPVQPITIVLPSGQRGSVLAPPDSASDFAALVRREALRVNG